MYKISYSEITAENMRELAKDNNKISQEMKDILEEILYQAERGKSIN